MKKAFCLALLTLYVVNVSQAAAPVTIQLSESFKEPISRELKPFFELSEGQKKDLLKGEVISEGNVSSPGPKQQQMKLIVAGIHPRNCIKVMRKLSQYENYHHFIEFIKESSYEEKTKKFSFTVDHALLPYPMIVSFKIPRIREEGQYGFLFESGFLKGLEGKVIVKEIGKYCLLGLNSDWRGPESPLPDVIFGTFVQTVGKIGLERLIRISLF